MSVKATKKTKAQLAEEIEKAKATLAALESEEPEDEPVPEPEEKPEVKAKEISGASESTMHALLEEMRTLNKTIAEVKKKKGLLF